MSEIKVDTVAEKTSANGVTIDGLNIKDSKLVTANSVIETNLTDNIVTLAKMASGTDGNIISYDASGNPVAIATGNDGQVLTSTGAGSPPAFETAVTGLTGVSTNSGNVTITDGNLTFGGAGHGIHLGVTSATAANLLDDYEEGTWTLAVTGQGGDTGQVSRYTKIGNRVFIDAFYECDTNVSATDSSQPMQGLPFSAGTSTRAIINIQFIKTSAVAGYGGAPTLTASSAVGMETYGSNFIIKPISTTSTNTSLYYRQDIFQQGTLIRLSGVYETTA